jgi:hypothetical protein
MIAALTRVTGQDAYALWAVGIVILCVTVASAARTGGPRLGLPRPTRAHLATLAAWLIILVSAAYALTVRR